MVKKYSFSKNHQQWETRWKGNEEGQLTWWGRRMLYSKQKILKKTIRSLDFNSALDVGCGLGFTLSVFKDLKINATGIDISETAVKICNEKGLPAFRKRLENVRKKYDLVFSDGMLEHFLNFEPYVHHLTRISNKYVLIIQTDHQSFWGKTSIYFAELFRGGKNVFEYNYKMEDFISVFKKRKFNLISNKKIFGGIFQLLLFQKNNIN